MNLYFYLILCYSGVFSSWSLLTVERSSDTERTEKIQRRKKEEKTKQKKNEGTVARAATLPAEQQYMAAKTSMWWDIENCQVPKSCDLHAIARNIRSALAKLNYSGPVSVSAYGDTNRIPASVQQALSSTDIALNHVPAIGPKHEIRYI